MSRPACGHTRMGKWANLFAWSAVLCLAVIGCQGSRSSGSEKGSGGKAGSEGKAGTVLYVDPKIESASCTSYDPAKRSSSGGDSTAYKTLKGAATAASAGQRVVIREGTYAETLAPANSGAEGRPITFCAAKGEQPIISGETLSPAINLSGCSHIVLDGLRVANVRRWLHAVESHHNIIRNCEFIGARDKGGSAKTGIFFQQATFNQIVGNVIEESTQDNLALIRSDRNLVEKNTFRKAKHVLWVIKGGNFNVVRGNYFHNEWQKIGEIYDCEKVGFDHEFTMFDCTKHNVVEGNVFAYTPSSGNRSPYAGIQYAGQKGIIRRNVFYKTVGPAFDMTLYTHEAKFNTGNRVYNNTFCRTDFTGISMAGAAEGFSFSDNVLKNNILVRSAFVPNDKRWGWYTKVLAGQPVQVMAGRPEGFLFEHNNLFNKQPGEKFLITVGRRNSSSNPAPQTIAEWQTLHPQVFRGNLELEPMFVDEAKRDFHLKAGSPMIDAATWLTTAVGTGNGMALPVKDVSYFCDGYGIPGVEGDWIQLEGQGQKARIVGVDHKTNVLKLDQALSWKDGQGVSLAYHGKGPDLGAFEYAPASAN